MKIQRYGWVPDRPDHRDYRMKLRPTVGLPDHIDLRPLCPPVYDQGNVGSCTANAIAAALQMARAQAVGAPAILMPSRLFIYWNERSIEGTADSDSGAMIRDGFKVISKIGACEENTWPYDETKVLTKPDKICFQEAEGDRAVQYARVDQDERQLKATLADGVPVVIGFTVYESFESPQVAQTGVVTIPAPGEKDVGGHAVLLVGYDDGDRRFIVRNSWGTGWGMKGYFTMPYAYVTNPDLADDFWQVSMVY